MHDALLEQLEKLTSTAEEESKEGAAARRQGGKGANTKLLAHILDLITSAVPANPASPVFNQGNTLGKEYRHWKRAKTGNGRYRLFFRYRQHERVIIFAWINDAQSLRTRGASNDAYAVFRDMLVYGNPPDNWESLLAAASSNQTRNRAERVLKSAKDASGK